MKINVMRYLIPFSARHDSNLILIGLREVGGIAAKFSWKAGRESFVDGRAQRLAIVLGKEDHQARPPLVIGGTRRIKLKHVGPVAD